MRVTEDATQGFAPREIVCALDLSPESKKILEWAGSWASAFGSRLHLFHAQLLEPPPYFTESMVQSLLAQRREQLSAARTYLEKLAAGWLGADHSWEVDVREGRAAGLLLKRLSEDPPDLLVMGSHARTGAQRLLLGSVAENVLRHARQPVLVVPLSADRPRIGKILCPVDFSDLARQCMATAGAVAARFQAELLAMHALEESSGEAGGQQQLCDWVPRSVRSVCAVTEVVRHGQAAEQIVRLARESKADLIVLGARHRPFLETTTIGTTSERVIRHSPCPVLVLPTFE